MITGPLNLKWRPRSGPRALDPYQLKLIAVGHLDLRSGADNPAIDYLGGMTRAPEPLPLRTIFRFWSPLALTWLFMAFEGPFLAAIIARLPDPKFNLAAYGVAFAFAILIESPVIMLMSASTALVDSWLAFRRLWNFTLALNTGTTAALLLLLVRPVFSFVTDDLIGLDPEVARLTYTSLLLLIPWPAAIGYRRFYQGLLIRSGRTRFVAFGTAIRLASMGATGYFLYRFTECPGAYVGAAALSAGVVGEAIASRLMVIPALRELRDAGSDAVGRPAPGYRQIIRFYTPLAFTMVLTLAVQPLITFFMGQSRCSLESLAALPVVNSLVFIFRTPGVSYQEAAIAMLDAGRRRIASIARFAWLIAAATTLLLTLLVWTPLARLWFGQVSGLTPELMAFALLPAQILVLMPASGTLLSLQRALLIHARDTRPVTGATVTEVAGIFLMLLFTVKGLNLVGATAAALSLVTGRLAGNLYLLPSALRQARSIRSRDEGALNSGETTP